MNKSKLFLMLAILALAGCETMAEVDKGIYEVADGVAPRDTVTGKRTANITSRERQIEQGNKYALELVKEHGDNINEKVDAHAYERIKRIFDRVHSVTHYRDEKWEVILVPEESFNAFVTGGTITVVHKGLLDETESDDEIAAVLGHEIGHVTANHIFERETYMLGAKISKSNSAKSNEFASAYSVAQEAEADKVGLLYAALAGYNPKAASEVWGRIYRTAGNGAAFFNSHPLHSERSIATGSTAKQLAKYYTPNQVNPDFAKILNSNTLWQKETDADAPKAGEGGGLTALIEAAANTWQKKEEAKLEQLNQQNRIHLISNVTRLLKVGGLQVAGEKTYSFQVQYVGNRPLQNLVLRNIYGTDQVLWHADDIVMPRQTFTAIFETDETVQKFKIQRGLSVDSVELAN